VIKLTIQYDPSGKEKKNVHIISEKEVVHLLQIHVIDVLNIPDLILKIILLFYVFYRNYFPYDGYDGYNVIHFMNEQRKGQRKICLFVVVICRYLTLV
jgi:hypothetical protein